MRSSSGAAVALALAAGASLGCTSPNTYATARTLDPGAVTHTVAVEGIGYNSTTQGFGALPIMPTYMLRVGVIDGVDLGVRIGSLTEAGADVKFNFLRGKLDMAIDAGAEAFIEWNYDSAETRRSGAVAYFHFPLILSYNVDEHLSFVATPGFSYIIGKPYSDEFARTQVFGGGTPAARLGLGVDLRWKKKRSLHPEITFLQSMRDAASIVLFGVGLSFGALPGYGEPDEPPAHPSAPATPPSPAPSPPPPPQPTPEAPPQGELRDIR